jgi:aminoglycoside phosphotransferase (APT) family kinase protein
MSRVTNSQVKAAGGKVAPIPRLDELLAWFAANMPTDKSTLVHGDFKPVTLCYVMS